jgi:hypothetical protein
MMRLKTTRRTPSSKNAKNVRTAVVLALLLLALAILAGCAGVIVGAGSNLQTQAGSLSMGSASLDFGSVDQGTSKTLTLSATNLGGSTITIDSATFSSSYFSVTAPSLPVTVAAGASTNLSLQFAPSAAGTFSDTLTLASNASDSTVKVPLTGKGNAKGHLSSNPSSGAFGSVVVGAQQTLTETLTNTGSTTVTMSQVSISGTGFSLSGIASGASLAAGQSTNFTVTFAPQGTGAASGSVTLTSNASNSNFSIPLSGTGITTGQLVSNPSSEAFGNASIGKSLSVSASITNSGGTSVTISQASISGAGFSLSGITTPVTLSGGQSTTVNLTFSPQAAGAANGSLTLTSNATNPTLTIPLTGTGVAAGQLTANPSSASFGNVTVGNQLSVSETVTNSVGTSVTISQASISGTGFTLSGLTTPATVAAGQSANFTIVFTPSSSGAASGTLTLTSNATNPTLTIPLSGTGVTPGQLTASPTTAAFGSVNVGGQQSITETVTNTGGTSVTISSAAASGTGFSISGITTPKTLAAGQSTSFSVTFAPQSSGAASGSVTVSSNAPNPTLTIPLSGTGASQAGQLAISPTSFSLGSVVVGSSGTTSGSLSASGASVTVTAASANNSAFTVSGLSLPITISAGQTVPFTITFSPQTATSFSASLTVTSNAQTSTITAALTGTGTPAPTHSVNLSWTASTSTDVVGYNVYRAGYAGSSCGSFTKINSVLETATVYTDTTVANSSAYCYATTAVDTSNDESSYSNVVSNVSIP